MATGPEVSNDLYRNMRMSVQGLATEVGTGTCSSNAVTINDLAGVITTEALTTAAAAEQEITLTNSKIATGDIVLVSAGYGTSTEGTPVACCHVTASTAVITITNVHATQALNGTLKIRFFVIKAL